MAITKNDVRTKLAPIIEVGGDDGATEVIVLNRDENRVDTVTVEAFHGLFSAAQDMTATALLAVEDANNYGYRQHIENWRAQGILN